MVLNSVALLERLGWLLQNGEAEYVDTPDIMELADMLAQELTAALGPEGASQLGTALLEKWGTG